MCDKIIWERGCVIKLCVKDGVCKNCVCERECVRKL